MRCAICKVGDTRQGKATLTLERGGTTLVIKGVPAAVCDSCGEEYVDEATADRLLKAAEEAAHAKVQVDIREYVGGASMDGAKILDPAGGTKRKTVLECYSQAGMCASWLGDANPCPLKDSDPWRCLLHNLKAFNRKERFFLVGWALGNAEFALSEECRRAIRKRLNLTVPEHAFCAMDYHLDWLYASLFFLKPEHDPEVIYKGKGHPLTATQEDIDLLIAFQDGGKSHLLMLEAKGVGGWTNAQLKSKIDRLKAFFPDDGDRRPDVVPHFVLLSPREPQRVNLSEWPSWAKQDGKLIWMPLDVAKGLVRVTRCDEKGRESQDGGHWGVVQG